MKYSSLVWSLVLAGAILVGCERRKPSEQDPAVFDPNVDAVGGLIEIAPDESLLADQAQLSRAVERTQPVTAGEGEEVAAGETDEAGEAAMTGEPADDEAIAQIRQTLQGAVESVRAGDLEATLGLFIDAHAQLLRPILVSQQELTPKIKEIDDYLAANFAGTTLAAQLSPDVASSLSFQQQIATDMEQLLAPEATFATEGENVVGTDVEGEATTFTPVSNEYKANLPAAAIAIMPKMGDLIIAQGTFLDEVANGLGDSTITPANLKAKVQQIAMTTVVPAMVALTGVPMPAPAEEMPMPMPTPGEEMPMPTPGEPEGPGMPTGPQGPPPGPTGPVPGMPTGPDERMAPPGPTGPARAGAGNKRKLGGTLGRIADPTAGAEEAGN